jgi:hypothetical protein
VGGEELDLFIDGYGLANEDGQSPRLEWWGRLDEESAALEVRDTVGVGRQLIVNVTGEIISKLETQGCDCRSQTRNR